MHPNQTIPSLATSLELLREAPRAAMQRSLLPINKSLSSSSLSARRTVSRGSSFGQTQAENRWPEYLESPPLPPLPLQMFEASIDENPSRLLPPILLYDAQPRQRRELESTVEGGQRYETLLAEDPEDTYSDGELSEGVEFSSLHATWGSGVSPEDSSAPTPAVQDRSPVNSIHSPDTSLREDSVGADLNVESAWTLPDVPGSTGARGPSVDPEISQPKLLPHRYQAAPPPFRSSSSLIVGPPSPKASETRSSYSDRVRISTPSQGNDSPLGYGQGSDQSYGIFAENREVEGGQADVTALALDTLGILGIETGDRAALTRALALQLSSTSRHSESSPSITASDIGEAHSPEVSPARPKRAHAASPVVARSESHESRSPRPRDSVKTSKPTLELLEDIATSVTELKQHRIEAIDAFSDSKERLSAMERTLSTILEEQKRQQEEQRRQSQELERHGRTLDQSK